MVLECREPLQRKRHPRESTSSRVSRIERCPQNPSPNSKRPGENRRVVGSDYLSVCRCYTQVTVTLCVCGIVPSIVLVTVTGPVRSACNCMTESVTECG